MKLPSAILKLWQYDTPITISILALFVTCLQLFLTTPLLIDLYFKPRLIIHNEELSPTDTSIVVFRVSNEGSAIAKNVEVGIVSIENDRIEVMPDLGASISQNTSVFIKTGLRTFEWVLLWSDPA